MYGITQAYLQFYRRYRGADVEVCKEPQEEVMNFINIISIEIECMHSGLTSPVGDLDIETLEIWMNL
jgi:hypothetical protein